MISQQQITAVVLAGGQARRMGGQDKGLLMYQDQTFIQHLVNDLKPQVGQIIINANRHQQQYADLTRCPVIEDHFGDFAGPLAGMLTGLQTIKTPYILFMPCDVPHIPDFLVTRLAEKLTQSQAMISTVYDGQRTQYLFALMRCEVQESLQTYLQQNRHQVRAWYQQQHVVEVDFSDCPQFFVNINTPEDLQKCLTLNNFGHAE
ncbi:molybdenum cofactor guanylyltransferase MobA [Candidatus Albibeggiatoa sp. nov. NOAA]|uniref:molybdenum cofactor guanylyltransferase MobA n=1 Tax=Candidatus Albibeggiatoa sp. nov. NOAA TaxID=3162724 RepID=UPI0032F7EB0C|nr:molybdenum cofactor guanylyltransferase [Thiotrichaceae bacterium]